MKKKITLNGEKLYKQTMFELSGNSKISGIVAQFNIFGNIEIKYNYEESEKERKARVLDNLLIFMDNNNIYYDYYHGCAEIGYEDKPMICADWNTPSAYKDNRFDWNTNGSLTEHGKKRKLTAQIGEFIETFFDNEIEINWYGEYTSCSCCNKAVRTSHDSYSWQKCYVDVEYDTICHECYEDNIEEIIDTFINNSDMAIPDNLIELFEENGFICLENIKENPYTNENCGMYETGFHPGQNDNPQDVEKWVIENLPKHDFVFAINSVGQFDISWLCMVRRKNYNEV